MAEVNNALTRFNAEIKEFSTSRLILVDKVINKYLRYVASDRDMLDLITESAKLSSYESIYRKSITFDNTGSKLDLPINPKQIVTLVTGLLFSFDNKDISIIDFITKFYPSASPQESYVSFCKNLIDPYAESVRFLFNNSNLDITIIEEPEEKSVPFPDNAKSEIEFWVTEIINSVIGDNAIAEITRKEYLIILNGMKHALEMRNTTVMEIVWVGLKNTLSSYSNASRQLSEVGNILYNYGVTEIR